MRWRTRRTPPPGPRPVETRPALPSAGVLPRTTGQAERRHRAVLQVLGRGRRTRSRKAAPKPRAPGWKSAQQPISHRRLQMTADRTGCRQATGCCSSLGPRRALAAAHSILTCRSIERTVGPRSADRYTYTCPDPEGEAGAAAMPSAAPCGRVLWPLWNSCPRAGRAGAPRGRHIVALWSGVHTHLGREAEQRRTVSPTRVLEWQQLAPRWPPQAGSGNLAMAPSNSPARPHTTWPAWGAARTKREAAVETRRAPLLGAAASGLVRPRMARGCPRA